MCRAKTISAEVEPTPTRQRFHLQGAPVVASVVSPAVTVGSLALVVVLVVLVVLLVGLVVGLVVPGVPVVAASAVVSPLLLRPPSLRVPRSCERSWRPSAAAR